MLISNNTIQAICTQIAVERNNAAIYENMEAYFSNLNLNGFKELMRKQADGEKEHARKFISFLDDRNADYAPYLQTLALEPTQYTNVAEIVNAWLALEQDTTAKINALVDVATTESDKQFYQWLMDSNGLVKEQVEEENLALYVLSRVKHYGLELLDLTKNEIDATDLILRNSLVALDNEMKGL